jgi:Uma2 family endonuclease
MTVTISSPIHYPSGDGQPVAETFAHLYAILMTIELLRLHFDGQQATVLGNQFLYYSQGHPKLRIAPDVMVIFNVEPGGRDNYKIWEEGEVPQIVFEMTSPSTRDQDDGEKKNLYEKLGIQEYWQFDPKGEWITEGLRGYSLQRGRYQPIANGISQVLGLQLEVTEELNSLISFYRLDSGEKLLLPSELKAGMMLAQQAAESAEQKAESAQQESNRLAAKLAEYEARFGSLED